MVETFGEAVRRWREVRGVGQRELARRAPLDPGHLSRLESGRRPPTAAIAAKLDAVLEAGGELVRAATTVPPRSWVAGDGWTRADADALADALTAQAPSPGDALRIAHEWLVTEPPQLFELRAGRRIGDDTVARVEERLRQLRRLDDHLGGEQTRHLVTAELAATAGLLRDAAYTEAVGRRLLTAVGELCQLAGWVAADSGRPAEARRHYLDGVRAAHAAGDRAGGANNLSSLAYLTANTGDPREAVTLARTAATGAVRERSATATALQWERVAWSHAKAGERAAAERALSTVERTYDRRRPADDPSWVYWLTPDEVDIMAGRVWTQLRRPLRAVPILQRAVAGYSEETGRETSLYLTWLAEALIQAGEIEEAANTAGRALRLARRAGSRRVAHRVSVIRDRLREFADSPAVRALEDASDE